MRKSSWIVVSAAIAISGCAGMSAEECQLADWETIGYEDGVRGASGQAIASHRKACAKAGVAPDRVAYERGRASGLPTFCRPANGYRVGESGHAYSGVCPSDLEGDFLDAYYQGREHYRLKSDVSRLNAKLNYQEKELKRTHDEILNIEKSLIAEGLTPSERIGLLADLKAASRDVGEIEQKILELERDRAVAVVYLQDFEESSYSASVQ